LDFRWTDADDDLIGYDVSETLGAMPEFPVTLTVTNEFGREATTTLDAPPAASCPPTALDVFDTQTGRVDRDETSAYVIHDAPPGEYRVSTTGTGDADVFVRVGAEATTVDHDCGSEGTDTDEECTVTLTAGADIHVLVRGFDDDSAYTLLATWEGFDASGTVGGGAKDIYYSPILPPGTYRFAMTGDSDADLYVSTGFGPFASQECYPYESDSNETCELHIDEMSAFNITVNGYAPSSSYQLKAEVVSLDHLGETLVWDGTFGSAYLVDDWVWPIWM